MSQGELGVIALSGSTLIISTLVDVFLYGDYAMVVSMESL